MGLFSSIFGDSSSREVKKVQPLVDDINQREQAFAGFSMEDLQAKTVEFKKVLAGKKPDEQKRLLDKMLPEAFAVVKAMCRKLVGKEYEVVGEAYKWIAVPFDVQMMGGVFLHQGKIAEMKTGEGKSLATLIAPVYLNALTGKGVHIVTVNDYLAKRDSERVGFVFKELGLSVGVIYSGQERKEKQEAYQADVTYGTNNEFGFDYLRDNMVQKWEQMVGRGEPHYAIIDEIDSVLIDEARTPLIISAPDAESGKMYQQFAGMIPQLKENTHYNIDEKHRSAALIDEGINKIEELLGVQNIYNDKGIAYVHHLEQALKAHTVFKRDKEYVVKDDQVIIVDQFTGRLMPGRRFSEGLHQALEAKEGVAVQKESKTLATITFQNFFRMYKKLAGATGTALTQEEEFQKVYGLSVVAVPTNKPMIREDLPDLIYKNETGKFKAVAAEIKQRHEAGQPILVGTVAIDKSEVLSAMLEREGISHEVLNAKHHEKEAKIIANAGQKGAVTIATNMAGRGTDIILGEGVVEAGGLMVIGTERHDARRIDNQLRGRSGRQGDPGTSQFFISAEDDLVRRFARDRIKGILDTFKIPDDQPIESSLLSKRIESAQKQVEGHNFDARRYVLQYDDVMNMQRETIYRKRRKILSDKKSKVIHQTVMGYIGEEIKNIIAKNISDAAGLQVNTEEISETVNTVFELPSDFHSKLSEIASDQHDRAVVTKELNSYAVGVAEEVYARREEELKTPVLRQVEKTVLLRSMDVLWMQHLETMSALRDGIGLRGYGQRDPLVEFKKEGYNLFQKLLAQIRREVVYAVFKVKVAVQPPREMANDNLRTSSADGAKSGVNNTKRKQVKVGRNEPCPCGSGKKYKKCHGK